MSALLFLYRRVLGQELDGLEDHVRARGSPPAPVVLTVGEVRAVLGAMRGHNQLVATLLYAAGCD